MPGTHAIGESRRAMGAALLASIIVITMLLAPSADAVSPFETPRRVGGRGFEPTIDIGPDGAIFVTSTIGIPQRSPAWRSTDGGTAWDDISIGSPWVRSPGGGDVDIAVGPDGRVYHLDLWAGSNTLTVSKDNGQTWSYATPFTTLPLTDRQWITVGGPGVLDDTDVVYVSYQLIQPPSSTMLARSDDGGLTWTHHAAPHGFNDTLPGQVVADGDFVAMSYVSGSQLWVARSTDAGLTWLTSRIDDDADVHRSIFSAAGLALDGSTMVASWITPGSYAVKVAISTDRGMSWGEPETVSAGGNTNMFPWVAARGGKIGVAWYGASVGGDPNAMPDGASWRVKYAERAEPAASFSAPIDASSTIKLGPVCTLGLGCSGHRNLGDFLQLAIDASGRSIIAFVNAAASIGPPGVYIAKQS